MPVKIESYKAIGLEIWRVERNGRRFVARCANRSTAGRIVRLLNEDLAKDKAGEGRGAGPTLEEQFDFIERHGE